MKIQLRTKEEFVNQKETGKRLREVLDHVLELIEVGITTNEIDAKADELLQKQGGTASFKTVPGYHWATCVPVNEQIVHTPPSDRVLQKGDVFTIDVGLYRDGLHTDLATTVVVGGTASKEVQKFLSVGEDTLENSIQAATVGGHLGDISQVIEKEIYGNGYYILKELTGHGVGTELHQPPYIPGYLDRPVSKTPVIQPGLVIAVEVIYSMGTEQLAHEPGDSWSIVTRDGSLAACFEKTIGFDEKNRFILT